MIPDTVEEPRLRPRRATVTCRVAAVPIGSAHPVVVQSMTDTDTADAAATAAQAAALATAGAELVRVTVNTRGAAAAVPEIRRRLDERGVRVPLVGDFHYNGHTLLAEFPECARTLDKYRINPGNVGVGQRHDENFRRLVQAAREHGKPVRIGVNWGSLDRDLLTSLMDANARRAEPLPERAVRLEAMRESVLRSAELAERFGQPHDALVLSAKVSEVDEMVAIHRALARECDYPLHIGLTEAGPGLKGIVASTAALAILLAEGIGDTIRASLTPAPGGERADEVRVCQQLLQSLGLRRFAPQVVSCPGCGRTTSALFQELAARVAAHIASRAPLWRETAPGAEGLHVAVMGCVVNGPGESRHADIGISLPGATEDPRAPVYADGELVATLTGPSMAADFLRLLDEYVERRFGGGGEPGV